jgi:hypothetical protein
MAAMLKNTKINRAAALHREHGEGRKRTRIIW